MNRKQRRASERLATLAGGRTQRPDIDAMFGQADFLYQIGNAGEAAKLYRRVVATNPANADAHNALGSALHALGKLTEAAQHFKLALVLWPQHNRDFASIATILTTVNPALAAAIERAAAAWPERLAAHELLGPTGISAVASDQLLSHVLRSTKVRNFRLERVLTALRRSFLYAAANSDRVRPDEEKWWSSVAQQCFINEYVYAILPEEAVLADRLKAETDAAIATGMPVSAGRLLATAMYSSLGSQPHASELMGRTFGHGVDEVITQQVREPHEERQLRGSIPRLTAIEDDVSRRVQGQYEESPFPRWVSVPAPIAAITLNQDLRYMFPTGTFTPIDETDGFEILVAGCGTGLQPIATAQAYIGAKLLAIDLSLTSLSYAKRKTPPALAGKIEYAQADILKLGSINRSFDLIACAGVLHHLSDTFAGWEALLPLLRRGGVMHVGLYSELARREIVAAREFITVRGYGPSIDDIRRARQEIIDAPAVNSVTRFDDFYSVSDFRDLFMHVQENRHTIPQIKDFIAAHDLKFLGFQFAHRIRSRHVSHFANAGWSMSDLDRWHDFEVANPLTFSAMYQFWVQKP